MLPGIRISKPVTGKAFRAAPTRTAPVSYKPDDLDVPTHGSAKGAVQTALNAVWEVVHQFGGRSLAVNPGPGDRFDELALLDLET